MMADRKNQAKSPNNAADLREFAERWKRVGPILETIRRDEIRRTTDAEYLKIVERVWSVDVRRTPRHDSGLVEFQRIMRR